MPGPLALVGSGEYLPAMLEIERGLIAGRSPRYVQIPTAAAPEGKAVVERWIRLGREQADRLGVEAVPVVARDRADADDPALAALVEGAGLIYLSGGDPAFLAETLRGTALWAAIVAAYEAGAALAGCSAGAMALTEWAGSPRAMSRSSGGGAAAPADAANTATAADAANTAAAADAAHPAGLGLVANLRVLPHFDRMPHWVPPDVLARMVQAPEGVTVVGVDEETALVGGPDVWHVQGRRSAWVLERDGSRRELPAGSTFELSR